MEPGTNGTIRTINGRQRHTCQHPPGCGVAVDMVFVNVDGEDRPVDLLECNDCGQELGPETDYDLYPMHNDDTPPSKIPCLLVAATDWLFARRHAREAGQLEAFDANAS